MNLIPRSSPFNLDSLFDPGFPAFRLMPELAGDNMPSVDITENDRNFVLKADFPGMKKEEISITLDNNTLTLSAEHREESEQKEEGRVVRRERRYGSYSRSFTLGAELDEDKIEASYDNGVLTLVLPKTGKGHAGSKAIPIK